MSLPDWPARPQPTPIAAARVGQQDADGDAFWFTKTPRVVRLLARALRETEVTQVYVSLTDRANAHGVCWPSYDQIADDSGITKRKAIRAIRRLADAKLITVGRGRNANEYTITRREELPAEDDIPAIAEAILNGDSEVTGAKLHQSEDESLVQICTSTGAVSTPSLVQNRTSTGAYAAPRTKSKTTRTKSKRSPNGDTGSDPKPTREPTRIYQVAEWYAKRVGGVIPGKGAREWADAKRLAETGITDDELPALFDWLAAQSWVKSLSLGLMASKYNDWRSSAVIANTEKDLPYNHHKSGKLVF